MSNLNTQTCPHCNGQLVEIDHYGERLIGCIECNQWSWRGGKSLVISCLKTISKHCGHSCNGRQRRNSSSERLPRQGGADVRFGSLADIERVDQGCPLCLRKQTFSKAVSMSAKCHKRTYRPLANNQPVNAKPGWCTHATLFRRGIHAS